ncbi:ThuA domain-containing protein [Sinomicrobium kalidii]|uniref:ThuA domain-containing protein n=1 Tax=Sinomicrobium kalidii TaxID=2900738 RepID=UPI001E6465C7|nr:ThuA domain-containing protein [Sinomicrobium kalidii]UGU18259.1 ThuA domain-containing protein [Sinomicrobium kalidii]
MKLTPALLVLLLTTMSFGLYAQKQQSVLVFTKTEGYRHKSIETGVALLEKLGEENRFDVIHTEDASVFTKDSLSRFNAIVFLNTTGDILNKEQQRAFEFFMEKGGGFVGVHAASDTEYEWPWYGMLVGAYFDNHPEIQEAVIKVKVPTHSTCAHLGDTWTRTDEWYNFKNISPNIKVLLSLDESSYEGGTNGESHPIAWYQEFAGGRSFYTGGGHTKASYSEEAFVKHLLEGIKYCLYR